jgi:hypothetical protein
VASEREHSSIIDECLFGCGSEALDIEQYKIKKISSIQKLYREKLW